MAALDLSDEVAKAITGHNKPLEANAAPSAQFARQLQNPKKSEVSAPTGVVSVKIHGGASTETDFSMSPKQNDFRAEGRDATRPNTEPWTPARPTQAYMAALRRPLLLKFRSNVQLLANASREEDRNAAMALCRDYLERIWSHTDIRDDFSAQYFHLMGGALNEINVEYKKSKASALLAVVDQVLQKRLDFGSRKEARSALMRAGAFELPELQKGTDYSSILADEEDAEDTD